MEVHCKSALKMVSLYKRHEKGYCRRKGTDKEDRVGERREGDGKEGWMAEKGRGKGKRKMVGKNDRMGREMRKKGQGMEESGEKIYKQGKGKRPFHPFI
jgi:hypothetical protein